MDIFDSTINLPFQLKLILACTISLCVEISKCVDEKKEKDGAKDSKWSLASLNPLSWLFPSKSEYRNDAAKRPVLRQHLPISRRAGLSDIKGKKTYNDLKLDRNVKKRRKIHPKQSISLIRGDYKRIDANERLRERRRRRRRRRKQAVDRISSEDKSSYYQVQEKNLKSDDYEEYFYDDDSKPSDSKESGQYDLLMSDFDMR